MNYDFSSLSSHEFEVLVRDLLQEELDMFFETFGPGRDQGIDLMGKKGRQEKKVIVQCKHYVRSGFNTLFRQLSNHEFQKVAVLYPDTYILATSVSLTPGRKKKIKSCFPHFRKSTLEIYGQEDLNNLLGRHPSVERRHIKLWLASEVVLTRVLHAAVWNDSELAINDMYSRMRRYVENPSLQRARKVLENYHYCIIAGIPGIGKTTLAEVLVLEYAEKNKYDIIRISHNISEVYAVADPNKKQLFYFDDFLGKTTLDKLQKNEDQRLVEFLRRSANNAGWRFVLTTREYILKSAQDRYEVLDQAPFEIAQCVVELEDYTRFIRGRILYNHIFFSTLSSSYKIALLRENGYKIILDHENYSPRVIEYMTDLFHVSGIKPHDYLSQFVSNLDNPEKIWKHAFINQISEAARILLLTMSCLPDEILLEDLEKLFWEFYKQQSTQYGFSISVDDLESALRELDGNFLKTNKIGSQIVIEFHNPSVRDFVTFHISESKKLTKELIQSFTYFEQFTRLFRGRIGEPTNALKSNYEFFVCRMSDCYNSESCEIIRYVGFDGNVAGFWHIQPSWESRVLSLLEVTQTYATPKTESIRKNYLETLCDRLRNGHVDNKLDLINIVRFLLKHEDQKDIIKSIALNLTLILTKELSNIEDFLAFVACKQIMPDLIDDRISEEISVKFMKFKRLIYEKKDDYDDDVIERLEENLHTICTNLGLPDRTLRPDESKESNYVKPDDPVASDRTVHKRTLDEPWTVEELFNSLYTELEEQFRIENGGRRLL